MSITIYFFTIVSLILLFIGFFISAIKSLEEHGFYYIYSLGRDIFLILTIWIFLDFINEMNYNVQKMKLEKERNEILTERNNVLVKQIKDREKTIKVLNEIITNK